jgi:3-isopropylmalate dehydrogenase
MKNHYNIVMLPGDGIGPEVMAEVARIMGWLEQTGQMKFSIHNDLIGGAAIDAHGMPLTDDTIARCKAADAVLLGAVGGPKWDKVAYDVRPEAGLLKIRKALGLFANLRPAIVFDALADASTLKEEVVKGLDILIVRELTGGIYFGEPRGISDAGPDGQRGIDTQAYTSTEIERICRVAFDMAKARGNRVCSVDKANVMASGRLWRQEAEKLHKAEYADIALSHMFVDNCAMQLVRNPKQFDVIVTDNLFGDILSDEASMLTGSLGMLPSASLGAADAGGRRPALYEPVHGSAPDIAGRGKANPLAAILSFAMCLRYSLEQGGVADRIEQAVQEVLSAGIRTGDIAAPGGKTVSTGAMGDAVIKQLDKMMEKAA